MRQKLFAFGVILAGSIAGAAWALQPVPGTPVADHLVASDAMGETFMVATPANAIPAAAATTAMGRVSSVDFSGRRVTIDLGSRPTALGSINAGDPVRVQIDDEGTMSANGRGGPNPARPRRMLGVWLLAITGTTVVLRARRSHTI